MSAAEPQPSPRPGQENVADLVLADIHDRIALGLERYGTKLQTFNGRDALMDAYQEALDMVMYLRQMIAERDAPRLPVEHPDMVCGSCADRLVWYEGSYSHEDRFSEESNPRHEHSPWAIKEWDKR